MARDLTTKIRTNCLRCSTSYVGSRVQDFVHPTHLYREPTHTRRAHNRLITNSKDLTHGEDNLIPVTTTLILSPSNKFKVTTVQRDGAQVIHHLLAHQREQILLFLVIYTCAQPNYVRTHPRRAMIRRVFHQEGYKLPRIRSSALTCNKPKHTHLVFEFAIIEHFSSTCKNRDIRKTRPGFFFIF